MQTLSERGDTSRWQRTWPETAADAPLRKDVIGLEVEGVRLRISAMLREGARPPLVFLHGFGSTKEDIADVAGYRQFDGRGILAFDAPGCGETQCSDLSRLSVPFLRRTADAVLRHYGIDRFHLVGHSMGGLTALLLASGRPSSPLSFANIKGNLAPEDCFLSRQILDHPADDPTAFLEAFIERTWHAPGFSHPLYASALRHKVRAEAIAPIFRSMVALSDSGGLLESFVALACPKMFVFGEEYRQLSYLGTLMRKGVQLAEIERAGHFPMYANPPALWTRLASFIDRSEMEIAHD